MDAQYRNAIGTVESNNNYKALGPETDEGDRAYGRYQVMGDNIPEWTQRHLGKSMTPQEFLANPDAQDKVFDGETSAHYKKYGNLDDVTSTWFSGRPMAKAGNASDGYNTVPQYVSKVNAAYGSGPSAITQAMRPSGSTMAAPDDNPNGVLSSAPPPGPLSQTGFDWNRLGDTLINMAPGIAQDPAHAQVLQAAAAANNAAKANGTWSLTTLPNGKLVRMNSKDGQPQVLPGDYSKEDRKWAITGKDKYGQPTYGYTPSIDDYDKSKTAAPAAAEDNQAVNLTGKDYLTSLQTADPKYASQVQSVIEGRTPYPTGMLLKTPYGQKLAQDVTQADPSFETGNAMARVKTNNEFRAGGVSSPAGQITAGNTALQHAGDMSDALEKFKGGGADYSGVPFASYYLNKLHNAGVQGTPEGASYNDFMTAKNHFSEEVTKFYAGSAGSEGERKRALANLDEAKSLPELRSAIKEETSLMQGKVNALQDRWHTSMGPMVPDFPLIQQKSQEAIDRITQRHEASPAATSNTPATRKTSSGVSWSIN